MKKSQPQLGSTIEADEHKGVVVNLLSSMFVFVDSEGDRHFCPYADFYTVLEIPPPQTDFNLAVQNDGPVRVEEEQYRFGPGRLGDPWGMTECPEVVLLWWLCGFYGKEFFTLSAGIELGLSWDSLEHHCLYGLLEKKSDC